MALVSHARDVDNIALRHFERGAETTRVRRVFKHQLIILKEDLGNLVHLCPVETRCLRVQREHCNIREIVFAFIINILLLREN